MENSELKAKTKSVYQIVKSLDEQKSKATSVSSLFRADGLRKKLIDLAESILLEDFENIGKKTRDILWRKAYYDPISTSKRLWKKSEKELSDAELAVLCEFIKSAIRHYKTLILKFEDTFNLDIRFIIDFSLIANGAAAFEKRCEKEIYTVNETNHAIETIHSFLICLGDLHRYCIEFKFAEKDLFMSGTKQLAASYYTEAFKLNPKIGMPHNQLGTLVSGENYEIDSIFHYLYSLCSPTPVELSETNVGRIFQQNNELLASVEPSCDGFNIHDFMMQVILLIDIFFYDKDIADFNSICFSVLMSFKEYMIKCHRNSQPDVTFQLTSIFMLCLLKLKKDNSPKVQCLNAFLVAFCAKIVETVVEKIEEFIAEHKAENVEFCEEYNRKYHEFDKEIRRARDISRTVKRDKHFSGEALKDSGIEKNGSSNSQKDGSGSNHMSSDSKVTMSQSSGKSQPGQIKIVKRPPSQPQQQQQQQQQQSNTNSRRRRKRRGLTASSSSSEESETESMFSDDENDRCDADSMNSDFDSYDEDEHYVNMRFSSDDSEEDDEESDDEMPHESDGEDILIENEEIVYKNGETSQLTFQEASSDDIVIEDEKIVFRDDQTDEELAKMLKMKYKKKYTKVDPNLILEFCKMYVGWMKSLKLLFDWLHLDSETVDGCYRSNPEFIAKIMHIMNFINIDIFTRKIYFDRSMITFENVREDLRYIFDSRQHIATSDDIAFKKCALFEELQQPLDWTLNYRLQITPEEDVVLRTFKMIDFGFHLSKVKKFNYSFCARSRMFVERQPSRRRGERRRGGRSSRDDCRRRRNEERGSKRERKRNRRRRRERDERNPRKNSEGDRFERLSIKTGSQGSQDVHEEYPSIEKSNQSSGLRKGYLKNRHPEKREVSEAEKNEMMGKLGKLWLKNEVQTLESRSKPANTATPYLMVDTNALIDYLSTVKNLVKIKKFIVLIPKAVLQDIDGLKKSKEGARGAIKWLETEFQKGNRFLRTQRDAEVLPMPFLKVPSKLEREDAVFMNIVPFANFIVCNNSSDCGSDLPILTLLTGENLDGERKKPNVASNINQTGILESIPVKYDQIYRFYSKYKKK